MIFLYAVPIILFIILFAKVTLYAAYDGEKPVFSANYLFFKIKVPTDKPKKPKKAKDKKPEKKKKPQKDLQEETKYFLDNINIYLELVKKVFVFFRKRAVFEKLNITITFSTGDAAKTAIAHGGICTLVFNFTTLIEQFFKVKEKQICVNPTFAGEPQFSSAFECKMYLRVFYILCCAVIFGVWYVKNRKKLQKIKTEAVKA